MRFSLQRFRFKGNYFFIIISAVLYLTVFIFDLAFLSKNSIPTNVFWTRESMIILASFLLGIVIYRRHFEQEKNIIYKLKTFFFSILGLYLAVAVPSLILSAENLSFAKDYVQFLTVLQNSLKSSLLAVFVTLFLIINLFWLREFIFYKSKRGTYRLFKVAVILVGVSIVYGLYSRKILETDWAFQGRNPTEWAIYGVILAILILLSLRTSWVNYLNKKQKIVTFWGGVLIIPGAFLFIESSTLQTISKYSFTLGVFDSFSAYFLIIYIVMAEISLLLHLPTASIFDKKMKEIASLQNLSRVISSVLSYDEVLAKVTSLTQDVLKSDSCWLEMVQQNGRLEIVSSQNLTPYELKEMPLNKNQGISGWVFKNKSSVLVNEVLKDSRTLYLKNYPKNLGSILGVPLVSQNGVIGILYAVKTDVFGFDQDDREMLQAFANQATVAIENARLIEGSLEKERMEQELRVAHDTQLKLLPKEMPQIDGLEIDALCVTAYEVGGDYYDFIKLDENKLGVVIADVSGKGLPAAFYMAELKGIVNSFARLYFSPKLFLQKVNETLYENVDRKTFVSMIYAIFDMKKKKMTFCRAGHCPLIYYNSKKDEVETLKPNGIGAALDSGKIFNKMIEEYEIKWHNGDLFFFFTDGLTEARNDQKSEFGEERVVELVQQFRKEPIKIIRDQIIKNVSDFVGEANRHDDLSLIGTKVKAQS